MNLTETERINLILSDPEKAPMPMERIIAEEIAAFRASEPYRIMAEAERYYLNRSDVQRKKNAVQHRSNVKIEHPILKKIIDQKASYLLSKPFTIDTGATPVEKQYAKALNELFDPAFRRQIKSLGKGAVKSGIAWLAPVFEAGRLRFARLPSTEMIPLWEDENHTRLAAFIRFYDQVVYTGAKNAVITRAEFWNPSGVRRFATEPGGSRFYPDLDAGEESPHFTVDGAPWNWEKPPVCWLKYNEEELPLCYFLKDLIDDLNWQTSAAADALRDISKFVYVLKNYGGQDLSEFVRDLRENLAVRVMGDGGVEALKESPELSSVMAFIDKQRRDIFDFGAAVDTKDPDLGNASGTAINFRYMDLDVDCTALSLELKDTFQQMKPFIDAYFAMTGKGRFFDVPFDIVFNMDLPVNETEIIQNVVRSKDILSTRALIKNHPWVRDADGELLQLEREKETARDAAVETEAMTAQALLEVEQDVKSGEA